MGALLGSIEVMPLYGQVVIQSEDASDLPTFETGAERAVASTECVLIATRGDRDGDVLIEVRTDPPAGGVGEVVFDGELSLKTTRLVVGNSVANMLLAVDVGRSGRLAIRVQVDPPSAPSRVTVLV